MRQWSNFNILFIPFQYEAFKKGVEAMKNRTSTSISSDSFENANWTESYGNTLSIRKRNSEEPPPQLMDALSIFIGTCGYIKIGYLPEICGGDLEFHFRIVIVMNDTWMMLKTEEMHNLFIFLRKQEECVDVDGADPYLPIDDDDFPGRFFIEEKLNKRVLNFCSYSTSKKYTLDIPSVAVMREISSFEKMIDGYMFQKFVVKQSTIDDLTAKIDESRKKCSTGAAYIKDLAANTPDDFTMELATNFFSLFTQYYSLKKNE